MFRAIKEFFTTAFSMKAPTITDDVVQRTHRATAEVRDCDTQIEKARFQKHMALHELQALEDWNHQRVLERTPNVQG